MNKDFKWYQPRLARPLVWSDRHNRIIAIFSFTAFPIAFIFQYLIRGVGLYDALWFAAGAPVAVFLTWAIGREMDPVRPVSALLAALVGMIGWFYLGSPDFVLSFVVLMCLRIVGRSTGHSSSLPESVFTLLLIGWLCYSASVFAGAIAALAFWLDARLPHPKRSHYIFALLSMTACIAASILLVDLEVFLDELQLYFLAVSILLAIPSVMFYQSAEVVADNGWRVPNIRTMVAIGIAWLFLAAGTVSLQNIGLSASYPLLCVLFGMAILNTLSFKRAKTEVKSTE